jgi:hypothetical protein
MGRGVDWWEGRGDDWWVSRHGDWWVGKNGGAIKTSEHIHTPLAYFTLNPIKGLRDTCINVMKSAAAQPVPATHETAPTCTSAPPSMPLMTIDPPESPKQLP